MPTQSIPVTEATPAAGRDRRTSRRTRRALGRNAACRHGPGSRRDRDNGTQPGRTARGNVPRTRRQALAGLALGRHRGARQMSASGRKRQGSPGRRQKNHFCTEDAWLHRRNQHQRGPGEARQGSSELGRPGGRPGGGDSMVRLLMHTDQNPRHRGRANRAVRNGDSGSRRHRDRATASNSRLLGGRASGR